MREFILSKIKKVFMIDPQSYNNLALYDKNLFDNIECNKKVLLGNDKFNDSNKIKFEFKALYKYSERKYIFKIMSYLVSQLKLLFILKNNNPDIIHFQWFKIPILDYLFLKIIKKISSKSKIVFTAHNILPHDTGNKYKNIYEKIYKLVDGIIVHTKKTKDELYKNFYVNRDKINVIPHGLLELNYNINRTNDFMNSFINLNKLDDKIVFGFIGSIRENKGIEMLLEVWEECQFLKNNDEAVLLIAGSCVNKDLKQKLLRINELNNIIIDIRFLPIDNFVAYLKVSDVILLPYLNISQSGVLLTALSEEKPILVSDRGGLTDPFEVGELGWIIEPTKYNLKNKIIEIINNKNYIKKIKNDNFLWNRVKKYYSWESIGKETEKFYEKIYNQIEK